MKRSFRTAANKVQLLERLMGLETEYALRIGSQTPPASRFALYQRLVTHLKSRIPAVPARHFKEGVFTANGGALWFEAERPAAGGGLIEGSTPECRGPRQLLHYQRAQDQLVRESAATQSNEGSGDGQGPGFQLIKNDRDGFGNVYGAQESYEVELGRGWSLAVWRVGLVLLIPWLMITWLGFLVMIAAMLAYLAIAGLVFAPLQAFVSNPRELARKMFGDDWVEGRETGSPLPAWLESVVLWVTRVVTAPMALGLLTLAWLTAFRRTRRQLTPFLVSRSLVSGAGMLDERRRFHLADKAPSMNCLVGFGGFLADRPVYTMGHFFKSACVEACIAPREFFDLFKQRQRLQIALGDSNMAEVAEYLRIGTTALVLDAIEAGYIRTAPRLARPISALHQIAADESLTAQVTLRGKRLISGLEIQRYYYHHCLAFVRQHPEPIQEAEEILELWDHVLTELEDSIISGEFPLALLGSVDWVTKRYLLQQAENEDWSVLKKIDIRYHELSSEGYFERLRMTGVVKTMVDQRAVNQAMRMPPAGSPAATRGRFIREFSSEETYLTANWKRVVIGRGWKAQTVWLARDDASRLEGPRANRIGTSKKRNEG